MVELQNVPTLQCQIQALKTLTVWSSSIEIGVLERKEQYLESSSKDVVDFDIENSQSSLSERDENISSPIEENNKRKHHRLLDNINLYLLIVKIPKINYTPEKMNNNDIENINDGSCNSNDCLISASVVVLRDGYQDSIGVNGKSERGDSLSSVPSNTSEPDYFSYNTAIITDENWAKNHANGIEKLDNISSIVVSSEPLHLNNPLEMQPHQSLAYSLFLRSKRRIFTILDYLASFRYPVIAHSLSPKGIHSEILKRTLPLLEFLARHTILKNEQIKN